MPNQDNINVAIETLRCIVKDLQKSLPHSVDPAQFTLKSKLPFTATSAREILYHRISSLANSAINLYGANDFLGGIIITRSIFETVALAYYLERTLNRFIRVRKIPEFHKSLMHVILAEETPVAKYKPINVTGLIDKLNDDKPGFKKVYNILSECVHPNWTGSFGTFCQIDTKTKILNLEINKKSTTWGAGVHALIEVLIEFMRIYASLPKLITQTNEIFENQ